jgi:tRNA/rRNA methyltransferase
MRIKKILPKVISKLSLALIEPEFGLNIGYTARVMSNFGLNKLIIVSPKKVGIAELRDAKKFASHARHLIEDVRYVRDVATLRTKFRLLVGTTAIEGTRRANLTRKTLEVEDCAARLAQRIVQSPEDVCLVFGRDTTGMTNQELRSCDYNMTIRASREYNTLNISHAVAIALFTFSKHLTRKGRKTLVEPTSRLARERTVILFDQLAALSGFQKFKSDMLRETIVRLLDRADPSIRETYLLMGLVSKASGKIQRLANSLP